MSEKEV